MITKEYENFLSNLFEGVYVVSKDRKIVFWNEGSEKITGYSSNEVVNSFCYHNILQHIDKDGNELCFNGCPLQKTLKTGEETESNVFLHHKNGHRIPVSVRSMPIYDENGTVTAAVEVFTDNRYRKKVYSENIRLQELLITDELTKVFNRRYMDFQISNAISEAEEFTHTFGLLFFDIDHFKNVNDTYGHNIGDRVLTFIANTINSNIRVNDTFGRWGGEEFLLIVRTQSEQELSNVAEKLKFLISKSYVNDDKGNKISVTVSIGGTLFIKGMDKAKLINNADENMYKAKETGRNKVVI